MVQIYFLVLIKVYLQRKYIPFFLGFDWGYFGYYGQYKGYNWCYPLYNEGHYVIFSLWIIVIVALHIDVRPYEIKEIVHSLLSKWLIPSFMAYAIYVWFFDQQWEGLMIIFHIKIDLEFDFKDEPLMCCKGDNHMRRKCVVCHNTHWFVVIVNTMSPRFVVL